MDSLPLHLLDYVKEQGQPLPVYGPNNSFELPLTITSQQREYGCSILISKNIVPPELVTNCDALHWALRRREKYCNFSLTSGMPMSSRRISVLSVCHLLKDLGMTLRDVRKCRTGGSEANAFHYAACWGHLDVLHFFKSWSEAVETDETSGLQEDGSCLTIEDVRGHNNKALLMSTFRGHLDVVQFLMQWRDPKQNKISGPEQDGAGLTIKDIRPNDEAYKEYEGFPGHVYICYNGHGPFLRAAEFGKLDICQFFRDWRGTNGERLTMRDVRARENWALGHAISKGYVHIVEFLRDFPAPDGDCLTLKDVRADCVEAIQFAVVRGHLGVLEFLRNWVDIYVDDTDRLTYDDIYSWALMEKARERGNHSVIQFLKDWEYVAFLHSLRTSL